MKQFNIILDLGHGGINSKGVYTTAPSKMHQFPDTKEYSYEGVFNRQIGEKVGNYLKELGYCVIYTVEPKDATDLSLGKRVAMANTYPASSTVFISLHSNASSTHTARGFEIFTSVGETRSDVLATYIGEEIINEFPTIKYRTDYSDRDLDKESQFYVLKNTICPAVLLENLFFDNKIDFDLLRSESFQKRLSWRISQGIIRYLKTIR